MSSWSNSFKYSCYYLIRLTAASIHKPEGKFFARGVLRKFVAQMVKHTAVSVCCVTESCEYPSTAAPSCRGALSLHSALLKIIGSDATLLSIKLKETAKKSNGLLEVAAKISNRIVHIIILNSLPHIIILPSGFLVKCLHIVMWIAINSK